jgi:transcriptional regulator with XRE-family HTH domain
MPRRSRPPRQEQADLARLAVVRRDEVGEFENGGRMPFESDLTAIRAALEAHGAIFIDENGEGPGDRVPKKRRGWGCSS